MGKKSGLTKETRKAWKAWPSGDIPRNQKEERQLLLVVNSKKKSQVVSGAEEGVGSLALPAEERSDDGGRIWGRSQLQGSSQGSGGRTHMPQSVAPCMLHAVWLQSGRVRGLAVAWHPRLPRGRGPACMWTGRPAPGSLGDLWVQSLPPPSLPSHPQGMRPEPHPAPPGSDKPAPINSAQWTGQ